MLGMKKISSDAPHSPKLAAGPKKHKKNKKVHYPFFHQMVSDRSSRAENLTDLRKISLRVYFGSKKSRKKAKSNKKTEMSSQISKNHLFEKKIYPKSIKINQNQLIYYYLTFNQSKLHIFDKKSIKIY